MRGKMPAAWSCFARLSVDALEQLYSDELGRQYVYDSHVVNHRQVAVGDLLVIRDGQLIWGYGFVESIDSRMGVKHMHRCPRCRSADLTRRKRQLPLFHCNDCSHDFDVPLDDPVDVTVFVAHYDQRWLQFDSPPPVRALDTVYAGRDRQNAVRRLDWAKALEMIRFSSSGVEEHLQLELLTSGVVIPAGFADEVGRRRIGQDQFRSLLLDHYGATCAVTGSQPIEVLDAAHLQAYADHPVHELSGGLLLRADVHRLFDRMLLTFDPTSWRTQVAPPLLERHERLAELNDVPIRVPERLRPSGDLIGMHHDSARARWKALARL